jgi:5-methyltetrahydrofolate--homocysteine methyltransferase
MIAETYKGIRPARVIPLVLIIWKNQLSGNYVEEEIGVTLTESMAMWPASSVSGYYFGNPESKYFGLGKIKEDQVIDYAKRSVSTEVAMKWLNQT